MVRKTAAALVLALAATAYPVTWPPWRWLRPAQRAHRLARADRSCASGHLPGFDAEGDDAGGLDADNGILELRAEGLAARRDHRRGPAHLDHARLPWRQHVVDHDARPAGALHVAELLGLAHPHAAHLESVVLGVVAE